MKNSKLKTKKFAKNRQKDAIVANLQLFKQKHLFSWTQLAPKVSTVSPQMQFRVTQTTFHTKKSPKKKKKKTFHRETKTKQKLIRRSHGVVSLSLSLAFESIGTNKLREGQLVLNLFNFLSLFLSLNFVGFYSFSNFNQFYRNLNFLRPQIKTFYNNNLSL